MAICSHIIVGHHKVTLPVLPLTYYSSLVLNKEVRLHCEGCPDYCTLLCLMLLFWFKETSSLFGQLNCNMNQWRCHIISRGRDCLKIVTYVVNLMRRTVFKIDLTYNAISRPMTMYCRLKRVDG